MKNFKKNITIILSALIVIMLFLPGFSFADDNLAELERQINEVNKTQSTPEKIRNFEDKLAGYFYETELTVIQELLKDFSPGETLALLMFEKVSGNNIKVISAARKDKMHWDKVAEKFNVSIEKVIKRIKAFRKASC